MKGQILATPSLGECLGEEESLVALAGSEDLNYKVRHRVWKAKTGAEIRAGDLLTSE